MSRRVFLGLSKFKIYLGLLKCALKLWVQESVNLFDHICLF